jgi:hypothetical protein
MSVEFLQVHSLKTPDQESCRTDTLAGPNGL